MEPLTQTSILPIQDPSQVSMARRVANEFAHIAGLDELRMSAVNIVTVELANNLLQHAGNGHLYITYLQPTGSLEITAVDHGQGMISIERCLTDGYSTASTPGLGLGAIQRFSTRFSAFSIPRRATIVSARMSEQKKDPDFHAVCTAMHGEAISGDCWSVSEDGRTFLVADGLGHGIFAAEASKTAVSIFQKNQTSSPTVIMEKMHAGMRATRGAAAAVAQIHPESRTIEFAGVGNITSMLLNPGGTQNLVSHNGTLGHQTRRVQQFSYRYQPRDLLLMLSDGLRTHSKLGIPPTLLAQSPSVVATLLYAEQVRGTDDATLLVTRLG